MPRKKLTITTPAQYFDVLQRIENGEDDGAAERMADDGRHIIEGKRGTLENSAREYLASLSPMQRKQIEIHAPNDLLRQEHEERVDLIDGWRNKHTEYMDKLARISGMGRPRSKDEQKTQAIVGAAIWQNYNRAHAKRVKEQGRVVQCQMCAQYFHSADTERIKPYGQTTYLRFCKPCGEKVRAAKALYQAMARTR